MPIQTAADSISNSAGSPFGFKNRIINGAMAIDQRYAGTASASSLSGYLVDRWTIVQSTTGKLIAQQNAGSVTPPTGFTNYLGVTSQSAYTAGTNDYYAIVQTIEGYNIADLGWGTANAKTATLSFWVRSSLTGTFGATMNNGGSRSYPITYTISTANTWEYKTITIPGDTSGSWGSTNGVGAQVWFSLGVGSTYGGTSGVWSSTNYVGVASTVSVVGTNGATFYITGVQFENGSQATAFDYRPYSTELALCQRYFESAFPVGTAVSAGAAYFWYTNVTTYASTVGRSQWIDFKVTKRVTPTITPYRTNISASNDNSWSLYNNGTWTNSSTATSCPATHHGFYAEVAGSGLSGIPYSYICIGGWVASAEL